MSLKVFVSSTSQDLKDYRAVARHAVLDAKWVPDMMEHWDAMPEPTATACFKNLDGSGLMILMVAHRQGWVPTVDEGGNGRDSITALELDFARRHNIPVLAFLASEGWPGNLWEDDPNARAWIRQFRNKLNQVAVFFEYESPAGKESDMLPNFRSKIRSALVSHRERLLREQAPTAGGAGLEHFNSASAAIRSGRCVPFLGHGVYGEGPLSTGSLLRALGDVSSPEPCLCLATAAEFKERFLRSRDNFLSLLEEIISKQAREAEAPAVHDLLLRIKPPFIISATQDLMLEERLEAEGKRSLILCHVVRSRDGEQDGEIFVFRGPKDEKPEHYSADNIELTAAKDAYLIYKPLGSPLLHRQLDPEREIDTVVMTEADHLILVSRLENQRTGVPTAFSRYFQRYPIIFLGYPMDVWPYRLVGQVFQSIGMTSKSSASLAVRVAASRMEDLAWNKLGADLLPMDPNDFARKVCESP